MDKMSLLVKLQAEAWRFSRFFSFSSDISNRAKRLIFNKTQRECLKFLRDD